MRAEHGAPSATGVLVIDDTDERKHGHATDHVSPQYLSRRAIFAVKAKLITQ